MTFQDLHELLRIELLRRIEQGALTGTRLAQQTGFQQAHISNFLNRKRALSLEGLDRVLTAQGISVDHLVPLEIAASSERHSPKFSNLEDSGSPDAFEVVPVVTLSAAAEQARVQPPDVIQSLHVSALHLLENRARVARRFTGWQRFVAVLPNSQEVAAMHPILTAGSIAVVDRHYNSIAPYRTDRSTLLAIRFGPTLLFRFVELDGGRLILRPSSLEFPLHFVTIGADETASDYVVGRVCLLLQQL